nr:PhzF family phenazine biosynthesis protein [Nannocystis sp. ILAH1]
MTVRGRSGRLTRVTEIACFHVDAFTDRRFAGNPAAVCPLRAWLPDATMQQIAAENALPETAFYVPRPGTDDFDLRWFTPEVEVDLCGHATLAAAFVHSRLRAGAPTRLRFWTLSGPLEVARDGEDFTLDFPARPPVPQDMSEEVVAALGRRPRELLASRDLVAVFASAAEVRALRPDMAALSRLAGVFGVIATAPGGEPDADVDFVSRFFAPVQGIPEDPVTGSAHCTLTPLWSERLGKPQLRARQVSRRGGELRCEVAGERVLITGRAVLVKSGTFYLGDEAVLRDMSM